MHDPWAASEPPYILCESTCHHVLHWADGGASDVDNAALLCQRHHTFVHDRRLWATVRKRPDERRRYVVWDLSLGSYDRQLQWLARQRTVHDPPALTRERLLELVAAITGDDERDRRLAERDLTDHADERYWAEVEPENGGWSRDDPRYRAWVAQFHDTVGTAGYGAA